MEPITVKSSINFNQYFKIVLRTVLNPYLIIPLVLAISLLTVSSLLEDTTDKSTAWEGLMFILLFVVVFPLILWIGSKKSMKRQPLLHEGGVYKIDDAIVAYQTQSTAFSSDWKIIKKVKETKTHFLLYTSFNAFHFLSKDGFSSAEDLNRFKEMVKAKNMKSPFK